MSTTSEHVIDSQVAVAVDTTGSAVKPLQLQQDAEGRRICRFNAPRGLYQLSVIVDAHDYDWEQTYVHLHEYHNKGQRTGPWDFELGTNRPLIPAYWVHLNGQRLGMWFFQRVSLKDIAHQRFRGNTAFLVHEAGEHELVLEPYQPMNVSWLSCKLESDPDDRLEPVPATIKPAAGNVPVSNWLDDAFWEEQQRKLDTTHVRYRDVLRQTFAWSMQHEDGPDHRVKPVLDLPMLVAGERLGMIEGGIDRALSLIDEAIDRPYWGKSPPDGYGHNGDMGAALLMRALAWAVHIIHPAEFGEARRRKMLDKLAHQGNRFLEQMLLTRDYWGGSLRQDHGWRSTWLFATAALLLHDVLPDAKTWLSYILPRMRRSLDAMSRDGMIPPSSHGSLHLYVDEVSELRRTLLSVGGEDLYERGCFREVVEFVCRVLEPETNRMLLENAYSLSGGAPFFADIARTDRNGRAAWLLEQCLNSKGASEKPGRAVGQHHSLFWSFFVYDPGVAPSAPDQPRRRLSHFADDARVHFYDRDQDVSLFVRCGPQNGFHAYYHAPGPCDRTEGAPHAGHFTLYLGNTPMLTTPVPGYRLRSFLGSVLLIDDQGQIGDGDYPMGIPSWEHPGYHILFARMDEQTGEGWIRMNLEPAYPKSLGVAAYTRDLLLTPGRCIICRDHVVLDQPRTLSWLFQADREIGIELTDEQRARIGHDPALTIEPADHAPSLKATIQETDVVHSYSSSFHAFDHVRYDTEAPQPGACVDFMLRW